MIALGRVSEETKGTIEPLSYEAGVFNQKV